MGQYSMVGVGSYLVEKEVTFWWGVGMTLGDDDDGDDGERFGGRLGWVGAVEGWRDVVNFISCGL